MSLPLPEGLMSRPLTDADVAAVAALIAASERHFLGETFVDEGDVAGHFAASGTDLTTDTLAVVDRDAVVAFAVADERRHLMVIVRPSHLGRGIGSALAPWAEQRAVARGHASAFQETAMTDVAAAELLDARGYLRTHRDWVLRMDPGATLMRHPLPPDVSIGGWDDNDARAVHAVIEDAFAEWEGRIRRSYEDWRVMNLDRDGADTGRFRVARADGEVVGAAIAHDTGGATWIHQLAVRADRRGQGLGQELMAEAFEAGRRRGCATGELSTSGLTGALGLYERLGMRVVAEFQTWTKELSPGAP